MFSITTIPVTRRMAIIANFSPVSDTTSSQQATFQDQPHRDQNTYSKPNEKNQIKKSRQYSLDLLDWYYSGPAFCRRLDEVQPEITYCSQDSTNHLIPKEHVGLHRVERVDGECKGKIHTLYFQVFAGPPHTNSTIQTIFSEIFRMKKENGELNSSNSAFGIQQLNDEIVFFIYQGNGLIGLPAVDDPRKGQSGDIRMMQR